jgi:DNA adenine methylase
MSQHGGKCRTGKEIAEYIHLISTILEDQGCFTINSYTEPFCGSLGVYRHIPKLFEEYDMVYKAADINESTIKMWQAVQTGWSPPRTCTEDEYNRLKVIPTSSAVKGFIGHVCAFGSQYFGSFRYKHTTGSTDAKKDKHISGCADEIIRIGKQVKDVEFTAGDYRQFSDLQGSIIYCDPPYEGTVNKYYDEKRVLRKFNSSEFWDWARKMAKHNLVFVSSYTAPDDFILVWSAKKKATVVCKQGRDAAGTEKLYMARRSF